MKKLSVIVILLVLYCSPAYGQKNVLVAQKQGGAQAKPQSQYNPWAHPLHNDRTCGSPGSIPCLQVDTDNRTEEEKKKDQLVPLIIKP